MTTYSNLELIKPKAFKRDHKVIAEGVTVGTLVFRKTFGSLAEAGIDGNCWTFKRVGFFSPMVTVRVCGDKENLATFINNTWKGGGTMYFKNGDTYKANSNFWNSEFSILSPKGKKLLTLKTTGFLTSSTRITIHKGAEENPYMNLMMMLACYLRIMLSEDEGAAVSNVTIMGGLSQG